MRRRMSSASADGVGPRLVVMGQCAFTSFVVRRLIRLNRPPAQVLVQAGSADHDPFTGLEFAGDPRWYREHRQYQHEWRMELREVCAAGRVPYREEADVFAVEPGGEVLLVAGLARRVPKPILQHFGAAALNAHPSLLPRFAGPQPEAQVILQGVRRSGVSIHTMTPRFDDGPVRYQAGYAVPPDATVGSLERRGAVLVARGIIALLDRPVATWPVISAGETPSYNSWYDADEVLDLSRCGSVEQADRVLRLRPEGYGHLPGQSGRVHPIRRVRAEEPACRTLPFPDGALPVAEWIEVKASGEAAKR